MTAKKQNPNHRKAIDPIENLPDPPDPLKDGIVATTADLSSQESRTIWMETYLSCLRHMLDGKGAEVWLIDRNIGHMNVSVDAAFRFADIVEQRYKNHCQVVADERAA